MRSFVLFALAFAVVSPTFERLGAQMDEQPPVLKRRDGGTPSRWQTKQEKAEAKDGARVVDATGVVRRISTAEIEVEAEDTRIVVCKLAAVTTYSGPVGKLEPSDIRPGTRVHVRAHESSDGEELTAVSVEVENPTDKPGGGAASQGATSGEATSGEATPNDAVSPTTTTTIEKPPEEDDDRPVLRHGIPPKRKRADNDDDAPALASARVPETTGAPVAPGRTKGEAPESPAPAPALIDKAREVNLDFTHHLPNFVCQQFTTRYERMSRATGWAAKDVVTATVVYVDGKEDYTNIKVGNRSVKEDMMAIKGQRSVGEFGSIVEGLFAHDSDNFHFAKDQEFKKLKARIFDFAIKREESDWTVRLGGQSIRPGYSGRVWIDRETGRILRMERQADKIPEAFPIDTAEQTIDYDTVMIGGTKILLPTESQNLACERGSSFCSKNVIEFRNYKQFRGEATIKFEDK